MREIKFRGKRVDNGEWVYGYYYAIGEYSYIHSVRKGLGDSWMSNTYEVIPATVGQFTGLRDKNGVEIYEGDLIEIYNPYHKEYVGVAEVQFSHEVVGGWVAVAGGEKCNIGTRADKCRITGNVHGNQELIGG